MHVYEVWARIDRSMEDVGNESVGSGGSYDSDEDEDMVPIEQMDLHTMHTFIIVVCLLVQI